ncbi:hypothetical protein B0A58_16080 [Flavobacterium branchiophilum NBRC 15030 = ATCC 35035]|nr:hypothetical protein B0A58_16080 [Flavobacterium branchiophilum NBRC 15030 = ATCC 35035]GEM56697.1 hypothetical protein FB1_29180 [Flavobacterium branchiophilum NBRC 15030 = ATCC 35035]
MIKKVIINKVKQIMKKIIIVLVHFFFLIINAQEMYKIDYTFIDSNQNTKCTLFTNNNEAIFKLYDERASGIHDAPNGEVYYVTNDHLSKFYYSNSVLTYCRHLFSTYEILYFDEYKSKLKWEIYTANKRKIGLYECVEAKTRLNGRNYSIWFTFDVPLKFGPLKFHNLPGMIIEIQEESGLFKVSFDKISRIAKPKEFEELKNYFFKTKKNVYNYKDYEKKVTETVVAIKINSISEVKKTNLEYGRQVMTVDENIQAKEDVNMFIDVPVLLLSELKKYRY